MIKLKDLLKEDMIGKIKGNEVYKNPKSIKRMEKDMRGMSDPQGNLYVVNNSFNFVHDDIETWLKKKGHIKFSTSGQGYPWRAAMADMYEKGYIYWQRNGSTNEFRLSESTETDADYIKELLPIIAKYTKKVKSKNSSYKFTLKSRWE